MTKKILEIQKTIVPFAKLNKMNYVALFGSFARGDDTKKSDVDLVVRFSEPIGLFKLSGMQLNLSKKLKRHVDIVTEKSVNSTFKKNIFEDLKVLYEEK